MFLIIPVMFFFSEVETIIPRGKGVSFAGRCDVPVSAEVDAWYMSPGVPGQHNASAVGPRPNIHTDLDCRTGSPSFTRENDRQARPGSLAGEGTY